MVPPDDIVDCETVVGIKAGDSGVVNGYQVDEFTHTWSTEWFAAHSHIYPGFTGKVLSLTHFPLEPRCEDYSCLDQAVADIEQGLDSILTDSIETKISASKLIHYFSNHPAAFGFQSSNTTR